MAAEARTALATDSGIVVGVASDGSSTRPNDAGGF
jgi:hypothetical protein